MPICYSDELKIVEAYKRGDTLKVIYATFANLNSQSLYRILRKHKIQKRGKGYNLCRIWDEAKATGIMPNGRPFNQVASENRQSSKSPTVASSTYYGVSQGMRTLQALLAANAISQADINALSNAHVSPVFSPKVQHQPRSTGKYDKVIKLYKQNRFNNREIAKLAGVGYSTVGRYLRLYFEG